MSPFLDPMSSPTGPSAADIFSSPQPGNAKRRLFQPAASSKPGTESVLVKQLNAGVGDTVAAGTRSAAQQVSSNTTQTIMAVTSDGRQVRTCYNVFVFGAKMQMGCELVWPGSYSVWLVSG